MACSRRVDSPRLRYAGRPSLPQAVKRVRNIFYQLAKANGNEINKTILLIFTLFAVYRREGRQVQRSLGESNGAH